MSQLHELGRPAPTLIYSETCPACQRFLPVWFEVGEYRLECSADPDGVAPIMEYQDTVPAIAVVFPDHVHVLVSNETSRLTVDQVHSVLDALGRDE